MPPPSPLIKGLFVNSHISKLREERGDGAVEELERRFGRPLNFKSLENVPVRDEVRLLELIIDLTHEGVLTHEERARSAGRLHFGNFATTSYGRLLLSSLEHTPTNFKILIKNSSYIARLVFTHTNFSNDEHGSKLFVTMENSDYPIEHFAGFFEAWMQMYGYHNPSVSYTQVRRGTYRYTLE